MLEGEPPRAQVVADLLASQPLRERARPYYEGMRILGGRTPELALIALRLTLAGRHADDAMVVRVRSLLEIARSGGAKGEEAREEYEALLRD